MICSFMIVSCIGWVEKQVSFVADTKCIIAIVEMYTCNKITAERHAKSARSQGLPTSFCVQKCVVGLLRLK